jgi:ADP-ribose pyrophosphatase
MNKAPRMIKEESRTLLDTPFIKVYRLAIEGGRCYYDASRRPLDDLLAFKTDEEVGAELPDAVTIFPIIKTPDGPPRLLLFYEFRYVTGQFLLSPPAGLIDKEADKGEDPVLATARRELFEETGLLPGPEDRLFTINPFAFSTPGFSDECNALAGAVLHLPDLSVLNHGGAEGTECFGDFVLPDREEALQMMRSGKDPKGRAYSMYTWSALLYFVSGLWEEQAR